MLSKTIFYLMENILHHVKDFFIFSSDIPGHITYKACFKDKSYFEN